MVTALKINLREDCGSHEHVKHVIKSRDGEPILDSDFVDGATIHTHPPGVIFFWGEKGGNRAWALTHLNEALYHELFYLPSKFSMFYGVEAVMWKVG